MRLLALVKSIFFNLRMCYLRRKIGSLGAHSSIGRSCVFQGEGEKSIFIGNNTRIGRHCILGCWRHYRRETHNPVIKIGDSCVISAYCQISALQSVVIGNGVAVGHFVYISDNNHGDSTLQSMELPPLVRALSSKGPVVIEDNVWIGDKASILGGVTIGKGSIIGTNAVVTHDVPPYSVVGGVPAKIIKDYRIEK